MIEEKQPLSLYIKAKLGTKYATLARAAVALNMTYNKLMNPLNKEIYSREYLQTILPDDILQDLQERFAFRISRGISKVQSAKDLILGELEEEDLFFLQKNQVLYKHIVRAVHVECERLRAILSQLEL